MGVQYFREFNKTKNLTIETADSGTLLNVLARASCFPDSVRKTAARVKDEVRNSWAHGRYHMWTRETYTGALGIVLDLVTELPDHQETVETINRMMK